jgi:hypothetical protein
MELYVSIYLNFNMSFNVATNKLNETSILIIIYKLLFYVTMVLILFFVSNEIYVSLR